MTLRTAVVAGVGAERGLGAALCRKFAGEGYHAFVAGRTSDKLEAVVDGIATSGGSSEAVVTDVTSEEEVAALFDRAFAPSDRHEPPDLVVYNAGNNRRMDLLETTAEDFEAFWRICCFGGFLVGREAARRLMPLGRGTLLFTGASGSMRGKPGYAHFAAGKAGLRMLSQSMAREFGPRGIHVAHVVVDGGINGDRLRSAQPARVQEQGEAGLLDIAAIADAYWFLHRQHPTAWTQEIDLRPFKEPF